MEHAYQMLTKIVDDNGNKRIACFYEGTNVCPIIHGKTCAQCQVFATILQELHLFEVENFGDEKQETVLHS